MKGRFWRKALAAALALLLVSGNVPIKPVADLFGSRSITASAETATSTITVDGTDYTLFTGFTATDGNGDYCANLVDGNTSTDWIANKRYDFAGGESAPAFVEFHADEPFIPKGYVLTCADEKAGFWKPVEWALKAKLNKGDEWTTIHYSTTTLGQGKTFEIPCTNDQKNKYQYFRFEVYKVGLTNIVRLGELQFYGFENLTYTHLTVRAATCTEVGIKQECWQRSDGKYFSDENGTSELSESDVIEPMKPHTGVHHAADTNHIEYWQCSVCGKYFSNETCTTEITELQTQVLKYLATDGTLTTLNENATTVTSSTTSWSNGWYVVYDDVTIADRINVSGTVNLILCDGATLTASKGITVGSDATLNIYAQTDDEATMGALVASGANDNQQYNAGIGGVDNTAAGTITINGGKINATGMVGAGIGSGGQSGATVGTITINGGIVTAQDGSGYGAGIGGGGIQGKAGTINLNGGIINAAGIGSGYLGGDCSITVNISDGIRKIVATPVQGGACIDKGKSAIGSVTVNFIGGGNIVTGDDKDAVFHDTGEGSERQIRAKALNHAVTMSDDLKANITVNTEYALEGETITLTLDTAVDASTLKVNDGTSDLTLNGAGNRQYTFTMPAGNVTVTATVAQTYAVSLPANMEVVSATNAADGNGKYISGTTVNFKASFPYAVSDVSDGTNTLEPDADGVYSVTIGTGDITVTANVERSSTMELTDASGDFTAINNDVLTGSTSGTVTIADNAKITLSDVTITGGIVCEGTAEITLVGTNSVNSASLKAGIQVGGSGTTLTIKGNGSLTANGDVQSAGIGLSRAWDVDNTGGNIVIEGGNITATGGSMGAGIGTGVIHGGKTARIGNITIKGGTVKATGGSGADGIGTGFTYNGCTNAIGTVTIYDGINMVDASSIKDFGSVVYMHGESEVTANKTDYFAVSEDGNRRLIVQKPVIADIDDQTYTGSEIKPEPQVTIGSLSLTKGSDYVYSYTNNTNVGTAKVTVTFKGDYASLGSVEKEFNIVRATPTVTAPTANTLTYNGNEQELVTAGSTDFGKVLYSLDGETYSEEVPKGTSTGDYTVFYKVEGNDNWNAVKPKTVGVTIAESYTITWKNGDEILETDKFVRVGTAPEYNGEIPTKPMDDDYIYTFSGWSPEISSVEGDIVYTAQFTATARPKCGNKAYWEFDSESGKLTISGTGTMYDYEYNTQPWYDYKSNITSVEIEKGITSIGNSAFDSYARLTSITIPDSVTSIGDLAFSYSTSLTSITIPDSVTSIGSYAFYECTGLTSITIPDSVTSIGEEVFYDCESLTTVTLPKNLSSIGVLTFKGCTSLESITIPASVTEIGSDAFYGCTGLTSITIPENVTSIASELFYECTGLKSITIPESVTEIGYDAFYGCTGLTDVYCYADPKNLTWDEVGCDDFIYDEENAHDVHYTTICHVPKKYLDDYKTNFGSESETPVNVKFVGDLVDMGLGEHLYGHSITLDGSIGVNFFVELTDELLASENAQMVFTVPNGSKTDTQTLLVKDVIAEGSNKVVIGSKTYYKFKCSISAKDMASEITAQLVDGEKSGTEYKYSVKEYADYLLAHTEVEEYANAAPLVKAMLKYGAASQTYFNEGTAIGEVQDMADVTVPNTFKFNVANATLPEGVTFEGATLSLKSETTLSLYFKGLPEDIEFTCSNKDVEAVKNGEYVVARIRGIKANELEKDFTVTFADDSVKYNAMTYCYNVLNGGTVDDNLKNVCKALYNYAQAAKTYSE